MQRRSIREWPPEERPMEKMAQRGSDALSDEELLAILLGSGTVKKNAVEVSAELLRKGARRSWLLRATIWDLMEQPGIGPAKASRIVAGLTLGQRLTEQVNFSAIRFCEPQTVYRFFAPMYEREDRELFRAVLLDTKNRPLRQELISVGTLTSTLVHPREVFRPAIRAGCNSLILAHNHPSGDPTPSKEDIALTARLVEAGRLLGIAVLDHIIVGEGAYVSLKQRNLM